LDPAGSKRKVNTSRCVPEVPATARANSFNEVYVGENRIFYALDRLRDELHILALTN
jgi:hypothetical protein